MIRGLWDRETVAMMLLIAIFPVVALWVMAEGLEAVARLLFFLVVAGVWHVIWMLARAQPPSIAGAMTAICLAMLAPRELGLVALLLSTSFGVVMAELAFGGWGRNVLNPATVTLAFMGFGYPVAPWPDLAVQLGWAAAPAALIGMATGVIAAPLVVSTVLALAVGAVLGVDYAETGTAVAVVLVLLVCDPVASAATRLGRWLNGALFGALAAAFTAHWSGAAPVQAMVSAALLASLAAPLLDELSIALWVRRRRKRFG
ncbi:RnfABCDGE type electron transport complex subunit D [Salipiger mucosus]|uniref:Na(+)-translocating NADH-quinone reductase subunit B n=1 Tax=Salipiger mucosus DSM 16094 TaxID=1123237 RepID=S9Q5N8_9RHOB|nr:RnfABCDGE type electron transport complex subunit D [Salipiger mucosus]EPX76671.1 Na(+)-translocating NADH-quinone reductase subunit B [Salipiger mucosus DSM 16094]